MGHCAEALLRENDLAMCHLSALKMHKLLWPSDSTFRNLILWQHTRMKISMCMCCIFVVGLFEKVKICKLSKRPLIGDSVYIMVVVVQSLSYTGLFCDPVDCSPPGSSVREISQARILEWVAISSSRKSLQPRDWTWASCIAGRFFTTESLRKPKYVMVPLCSGTSYNTEMKVVDFFLHQYRKISKIKFIF